MLRGRRSTKLDPTVSGRHRDRGSTGVPYEDRGSAPAESARSPAITSASERCPLPSIPAIPRISPRRAAGRHPRGRDRSADRPRRHTESASSVSASDRCSSTGACSPSRSVRSSGTSATARESSPNISRTMRACHELGGACGELCCFEHADDAAGPQDRDPVRDGKRFVQLVRDEDDRDPGLLQAAQDFCSSATP